MGKSRPLLLAVVLAVLGLVVPSRPALAQTNLLVNGGFTDTITPWSYVGYGAFNGGSRCRSGNWCFNTDYMSVQYTILSQSGLTLAGGYNYTFSMWLQNQLGYDASHGVTVSLRSDGQPNIEGRCVAPAPGSWSLCSLDFVVSVAGSYGLYVANGTGNLDLDDVSLVQGASSGPTPTVAPTAGPSPTAAPTAGPSPTADPAHPCGVAGLVASGANAADPRMVASVSDKLQVARAAITAAGVAGDWLYTYRSDIMRAITYIPDPSITNQIRHSWHKTGRAIDVPQTGPGLRHTQDGLYETLWIKNSSGVDVNITQIMVNAGFNRIPSNPTRPEWWHYEDLGGLNWQAAVSSIYPVSQLQTIYPELDWSQFGMGGAGCGAEDVPPEDNPSCLFGWLNAVPGLCELLNPPQVEDINYTEESPEASLLPVELAAADDGWSAVLRGSTYDFGCPLDVDKWGIKAKLCIHYQYINQFKLLGQNIPIEPLFYGVLVCIILLIIKRR